MSSSESNGHEPFELDPTEMLPQKPETSPLELSLAPRVPFLIKREEVPQRNFTGDTPFKETHEAALKMVSTVAPPKIRQNVYQLNSQNLEAHKQRIAEMSKPATWAQAVQPKNNLPNNKAAVVVVVEKKPDSENLNGRRLSERTDCDKENDLKPTDVTADVSDDDADDDGNANKAAADSNGGPVWILPPADEEAKKKKKKSKNKKKVAKI